MADQPTSPSKIRESSIPKPKRFLNSSLTIDEYWTDDRRKEASERAKRMIADGTTLFGSPESGRMAHRNRKRMLDKVADVAAERGEEIATELTNMLRSGNHRKKIDAIDRFTRISESAAKNEREHEKELRAMTPDQLKALVLERLSEILPGDDVSEFADGEATEMSEVTILPGERLGSSAPHQPPDDGIDEIELHPDDPGTPVGGDLLRSLIEREENEQDDEDAEEEDGWDVLQIPPGTSDADLRAMIKEHLGIGGEDEDAG